MAVKVADNLGDEDKKIVFIFACPGRREEKHNVVCYGATGTNLEKLLNILNNVDPKNFLSTNRYDYTIINACTTVYPNSDNPEKTEPDNAEIDEDSNLERIHEKLKGKEHVICFGASAKHAIDSVKNKFNDINIEVIESDHLSPSNLNRHYKSGEEKPSDRNLDRIIQASEKIIKAFDDRNNG